MENRRRAFLTEPGDALVLARTALEVVERYSTFASESGLDGQYISSSPLLAIPVPIASKSAGPRGWSPDANPSLFWHPLFWLPPRVALRYRLEGDDGEPDIETESEWLVRVALEVTLSELYSPADGTWVDVLSLYGLDIEDPAVQARVSAWLTGVADEVLDTIDLTPLLDLPGDIHWALGSTAELLPSLRPASWALIANDLADTAGELSLEAFSDSEGGAQVATLVNLALATLGEVPSRTETGEAPHAQWSRLRESVELSSSADFEEMLAALSDSFYEIRDDYWPFVELLDHEIAEQDNEG